VDTNCNIKSMKKDFGSTLFIVGSPFQCLCMLEAINHFNIKSYKVLFIYFDHSNLEKVDILLKRNNILYTKKKVAHIFYGVIPFLFSIHTHYKNIFIGYLYSMTSIAIANIMASYKANIYILDDGVQALSFFSSTPRNIINQFPKNLLMFFYRLIGIIKLVREPVFFTIFDVTSHQYKIIKNPLILLKKTKDEELKTSKDVFIIGTNSSLLKFRDHSYEEYLIALSKYILQKCPNEDIYYCPHRADKNLEKIYAICDALDIKIFDTKISVEYDFIESGINPKLVIGFTSNALYTLHMIFPNSIIQTVMYNLESELYDKEIQVIRNKMKESGISTINVL